jgi:hypothetical protein
MPDRSRDAWPRAEVPHAAAGLRHTHNRARHTDTITERPYLDACILAQLDPTRSPPLPRSQLPSLNYCASPTPLHPSHPLQLTATAAGSSGTASAGAAGASCRRGSWWSASAGKRGAHGAKLVEAGHGGLLAGPVHGPENSAEGPLICQSGAK